MKFLIFLLLAIIAFSNCEDLQVLVKNFEAKIKSILEAKNFDDFSKYLHGCIEIGTNETNGETVGIRTEDFINCLKNGTFTLFKGIGPNDVPKVKKYDHKIEIRRNFTNGRRLVYSITAHNSNEFGYVFRNYFDLNV